MSDDAARIRFRRRLTLAGAVGLLAGVVAVLWLQAGVPPDAGPHAWKAPASPRLAAALVPSAQEEKRQAAAEEATSPQARVRSLGLSLDPEAAFESEGRLEQTLPDGSTVVLTLRPKAQEQIERFLGAYDVPFAAVVALDPHTGNVLALVEGGTSDIEGLARKAIAPSASVFKLVTAAALLEDAAFDPKRDVCYHGGRRGIERHHLTDDPERDTKCTTLGDALADSTNAVFAKLANTELGPGVLRRRAAAFGFERALPFALPVELSPARLPTDRLERARAAAGFHHVHLSVLHGALIAAAIANDGEMMTPRLVNALLDADGRPLDLAPPTVWQRAVRAETAAELSWMMEGTVAFGTAKRYFDEKKRPENLKGMRIAGKTGSLTSRGPDKLHFSWFVGFAPADEPKVALAAMVANPPDWLVKAPTVAMKAFEALLSE